MTERLGDAPIEQVHVRMMNTVMEALDETFNPGMRGKDRKVGLVLVISGNAIEHRETTMCAICNNKQYLVCERSDNRDAVERCDACSPSLSDTDAAELAQRDGIACQSTYPCYTEPEMKGTA